MEKNLSKNLFLISFLPALAYWYLEANYSLRVALIGGLTLAFVEILLEYSFTRAIHTLSKFNFGLILFLGALSLLGEEGIWFKLQPLFTGVALFSFMWYRLLRGRGLLLELLDSLPKSRRRPPDQVVSSLEKHLAAFFLLYGLFMGGLALFATTAVWLFFKVIGFYIAFLLFLLLELLLIRRRSARALRRAQEAQVLKRFRPS